MAEMLKHVLFLGSILVIVRALEPSIHQELKDFAEHRLQQLFPAAARAVTPNNCPIQPFPVTLSSDLPHQVKDALSKLDELASKSVDSTSVPAIAVGVTYMGKTIWSGGYGETKRGSKIKPDTNNIFRIGSISKIFPVIMLYQMYSRGIVESLDDPLMKYAPHFQTKSESNITLRQMASQMSGLPREAPCTPNLPKNLICPNTNDGILGRLRDQHLVSPPWTQPSYSNLAYALLGRLLMEYHSKGKMDFETYVQQEILDPLGMTATGFKYTTEVVSKMAVGYYPNGNTAPLYDLGWEGPAGQMYSTIADLNKLAEFLYSAHVVPDTHSDSFDHVLSADLRREISLPLFVNPDKSTGFGTPWEILYQGNYTIRTKGGNVDGYSALFSFIPGLHLGINALFSGSFDEFSFASRAYQAVLPGLVDYLASLSPKIPHPPNADLYTGKYNSTVFGVEVFSQDNVLYFRIHAAITQTLVLWYQEPFQMQIYYPQSMAPCIQNELSATYGEWVYFEEDSHHSPGFTVPGIFPYYKWKRVNSGNK